MWQCSCASGVHPWFLYDNDVPVGRFCCVEVKLGGEGFVQVLLPDSDAGWLRCIHVYIHWGWEEWDCWVVLVGGGAGLVVGVSVSFV